MRLMLMVPSYTRIGTKTLDSSMIVMMVALNCLRYPSLHFFNVLQALLKQVHNSESGKFLVVVLIRV